MYTTTSMKSKVGQGTACRSEGSAACLGSGTGLTVPAWVSLGCFLLDPVDLGSRNLSCIVSQPPRAELCEGLPAVPCHSLFRAATIIPLALSLGCCGYKQQKITLVKLADKEIVGGILRTLRINKDIYPHRNL